MIRTGGRMSEKIMLSLGSNMGNRRRNLDKAVSILKNRGFEIHKISSAYETEPVGLLDQNNFYNIAVSGYFSGEPSELLTITESVEAELGRERVVKYGPRTIDIDIIFFGSRTITTMDLIIPHPQYSKRRFVLIPVVEIEPDWIDFRSGKIMSDVLNGCGDRSEVNKLKDDEK